MFSQSSALAREGEARHLLRQCFNHYGNPRHPIQYFVLHRSTEEMSGVGARTAASIAANAKASSALQKKKQLKLVQNREVRAVPGGYYTGLITEMHEDHRNYREKGTFLQMDRLHDLVQQSKETSRMIDRFNDETRLEERKLDHSKAPLTLAASSLRCTLPADFTQLEDLSSFEFLIRFATPSANRRQVVLKLIRKSHRDSTLDLDEAKDLLSDYFNGYRTDEDINALFHFLDLHSIPSFSSKAIVVLCCYAERYFLHQLARRNEAISFERPLQEIIDFEFLRRKFAGLKLTESFRRLIKSLESEDQQCS